MLKVVIPTKIDDYISSFLKEKGYDVVQDDKSALIDIVSQNRDLSALIVRSEVISKDIIDLLPNLKVIVRAGSGYNTIDTIYARSKDICVMNTPGANSNAVAEEVIAMILAVKRNIIKADISTRNGLWEKHSFMGSELSNKVIGIVGFGHVGKILLKRLSGFDMKVLIYDPFISFDNFDDNAVVVNNLSDIFSDSDIISLHIPSSKATHKIINKDLLSLMKEDSILINCARYDIINEDDLRLVKLEKNIMYCTDVYSKDVSGDKEVKDIADIMLPHLGASTKEANFNAAKKSAEQLVCFFSNDFAKIKNCIVN